MARKHAPLVVAGHPVEVTGKGFRLLKRPTGVREAWWRATAAAEKAGFQPPMLRLHGDLDSRAAVETMFIRCNDLWAEMLEWIAAGGAVDSRPIYDGTVASLVDCYVKDPQSPYHDLPYNTQRGYASWLRPLKKIAGRRRISALTGADLRTWHTEIRKPTAARRKPRERLAKAVIQIFRIVIGYGRELGLPDCLKLALLIEGMEFRKETREKKFGRQDPQAAKVVMSYDQAEAIVVAGLAMGHRGRSVALAVAAQFEFTLSQIDAIGYWLPLRLVPVTDGMIVRGGKAWRPGLTFEDFAGGILDMARLKTARAAQFDVAEYPLFQLALEAVPEADRHGPLITDVDGDPVRYRVFYGMFSKVREAAGVPAQVWNSRARHGGGTEARASGASIDDTADHLQKSDVEGTRRDYVASNVETTRRVARRRVAARKLKAAARTAKAKRS